ncbi:VOC family protein [Leeuwenhoekiella parthenopeia]|uniref:VOC family protein n=1 Tax=Leeuwenhoekiella parthenopeia TaxID=2890320 RepID=A0ABS8GP38_9FLAO|nr:VOC family protein [Leeuwenhoekiella parthenopeia]MCC4211443.1 VOC family protein [Leeuwenhoekiella parthenopeia]
MTTVKPYLTFRGECQEALNFYQDCFGGDIINKETYEGKEIDIPGNYRNKLQHAELKGKGIHLMAYDASPDTPVQQGNTVQLGVDLDSKEEVSELFKKLSAEGQSLADPQETSWNAYYARVRDKYGISWMLNADLN